jgi:WD40 repeat protein
MKVTI